MTRRRPLSPGLVGAGLVALVAVGTPAESRAQVPSDSIACQPGVVPDVRGWPVERAEALLRRCRFEVSRRPVPSTREKPGIVLDQFAPPPEADGVPWTVFLDVAAAPTSPADTVPGVVGRSRTVAILVLDRFDLRPRFREAPSDDTPTGTITAQRPAAGERSPPNRVVDVVVSSGSPPAVGPTGGVDSPPVAGAPEGPGPSAASEEPVPPTGEPTLPPVGPGEPGPPGIVARVAPDLTGRTLREAESLVEGRGLRVAVEPAVTWPGERARIAGQRPEPGVVLAPGATILVTPRGDGWPIWLMALLAVGAVGVVVTGGRAVQHRLWPRVVVRSIPGQLGPAAEVSGVGARVEREIRLRFDGGPSVSRIRRPGAPGER